jgi:hypothetical protein
LKSQMDLDFGKRHLLRPGTRLNEAAGLSGGRLNYAENSAFENVGDNRDS